MSQYQEYKPKKPRNLTVIVIGGLLALLIILLMIAYAIFAKEKIEPSIQYPAKITIPAGEHHSTFQMEEDIMSDTIISDIDVDMIEDMLIKDPDPDLIVKDEATPATSEPLEVASIPAPVIKEHYKPVFVATPKSPQWMVNAVPANIDPNKPMVAIVIDDLGINKRRTQKTIDLPAPLNLAFLPYPTQLPEQTATAKSAGHELIVHMPMEPSNLKKNNPGPNALLTENKNATNLENLKKSLNQFDGYVGINNHMGSAFTSNYDAMGPILEELKRRGLLFLDSRTIGSSKGQKLAKELDLPFVSRDVFLDHDPSRAGVDASLAKTMRVALKKGTAVAIGHPKDSTIAALKEWIPYAKSKGIQLVPLTAIAYKRMGMISEPVIPATTAEVAAPIADAKIVQAPKDVKMDDIPIDAVAKSVKSMEVSDEIKPVTVTVGDDESYDGIIWNEPEPTTY